MSALMQPCLVCGELSDRNRCTQHRPKDQRPRDRVTRAGTQRWKRLSAHLRAQQPFCTRCGAVDDLTVDHIVPLSAGADPYNPTNLQVLCRRCNSQKGGA